LFNHGLVFVGLVEKTIFWRGEKKLDQEDFIVKTNKIYLFVALNTFFFRRRNQTRGRNNVNYYFFFFAVLAFSDMGCLGVFQPPPGF